MIFFNNKNYCLIWVNPSTKEKSFLKGSLESYYWERGCDSDVLVWPKAKQAKDFAKERVNVPYIVRPVL